MTDPIAVHPSLAHPAFTPLFALELQVGAFHKFGGTGTTQQAGIVTGGRFEGERLRGEVLPGGTDWQTVLADGTTLLDVKLPLLTHDGAQILMRYTGVRSAPPEVLARLAAGEVVDPREVYFRTNPTFFTGDERYAWLNRLVAFGLGQRLPSGPVYNVFELK